MREIANAPGERAQECVQPGGRGAIAGDRESLPRGECVVRRHACGRDCAVLPRFVEDREGIGRGFALMEVGVDLLGGFGGDDGGEGIEIGGGDAAQAAEVLEEALAGAGADAGDGEEF
jgi:hypothetical protein